MKTVLAAVALSAIAFIGCRSSRELSVEMVSAKLIRIDTIFRNSDNPRKQLTWRDADDIDYISVVSMNQNYPVGMMMSMLRPR